MSHDTTLLLGLEGVTVQRVQRVADGRPVVVLATADQAARCCPECGTRATRSKGRATTRPRDLPVGGQATTLV